MTDQAARSVDVTNLRKLGESLDRVIGEAEDTLRWMRGDDPEGALMAIFHAEHALSGLRFVRAAIEQAKEAR